MQRFRKYADIVVGLMGSKRVRNCVDRTRGGYDRAAQCIAHLRDNIHVHQSESQKAGLKQREMRKALQDRCRSREQQMTKRRSHQLSLTAREGRSSRSRHRSSQSRSRHRCHQGPPGCRWGRPDCRWGLPGRPRPCQNKAGSKICDAEPKAR